MSDAKPVVTATATAEAEPIAESAEAAVTGVVKTTDEHNRALQRLDTSSSDLRHLFSKLDRDGNGRISSTEWARGMSSERQTMTKERKEKI